MEKICSLRLNNIVKRSKATLLSIFAPLISVNNSLVITNLYINFGRNT